MYGVGGRTGASLVLGLSILANAPVADAADLDGGDCCSDLEERIAELEATTARKGNRKVSLTIGGSVNEALLFWDDGKQHDVYVGTNDAARGRFRFQGDARINKEWSAGYLLEIGVRSNRLNRTDQFHDNGFTNTVDGPVDASGLDLRHSAWWIQHKDLGRIWLGQTDQATERNTEITLANTNNFLKHYGRWNSSFILRFKDSGQLALAGPNQVFVDANGQPTTNFRTWGNLLPQSGFTGEGVPGEGDRWHVIKYDSPEIAGFVTSVAWGEDDFWDVALRYGGEHGGFKLAGGIGYSDWTGSGSLNDRGCAIAVAAPANPSPNPVQFANGEADCQTLGLSGSIIHIESGLFVTGGYGIKWDNNRSASFNAVTPPLPGGPPGRVDETDDFYFANVGIEQKFKALGLDHLGRTTIYGEYERYNTGAIISGSGQTATGRPRSFGATSGFPPPTQYGSGAEINVWGFGVNQNIEAASLDLYAAYRWAEAELQTSSNGAKDGPNARTFEFEPMQMIMTGAVIKF